MYAERRGERYDVIAVTMCQTLKGDRREEALSHLKHIAGYYARKRESTVEWHHLENTVLNPGPIKESARDVMDVDVTGSTRVLGMLLLDDSNRGAITSTFNRQSNTLLPLYDALKKKCHGLVIVMKSEMDKPNTVMVRSTDTEDRLEAQLSPSDLNGQTGHVFGIWQKVTQAQSRFFADLLFRVDSPTTPPQPAMELLRSPAPVNQVTRWVMQRDIGKRSERQSILRSEAVPSESHVFIHKYNDRQRRSTLLRQLRIHLITSKGEKNVEYPRQVQVFQETCIPDVDVSTVQLLPWRVPDIASIASLEQDDIDSRLGPFGAANVAIILDSADLVDKQNLLAKLLHNLSEFDMVLVCAAFDSGFLEPAQDQNKAVSSSLLSRWDRVVSGEAAGKARLLSWWTTPSQAVADNIASSLKGTATIEGQALQGPPNPTWWRRLIELWNSLTDRGKIVMVVGSVFILLSIVTTFVTLFA
ncbi:uncharacterized protein LOC135812016 [Sycon ciliatum]|uniref:uncharacterized protein LOC135812016 n=1 Tax=Sycon ciliatum TaxID=27933 RepID=UPI0031F663E8